MLGSDQSRQTAWAAKRLGRLARFVAFSLLSLSLLEPTSTAFAQQSNPYLDAAYSSDIKSQTRTEPVSATTPKPLRLPPATFVDHVDTHALPEPTRDSRFSPIQVRTPTWLPAVTSSTKHTEGRRLLDQAHHEYSVAAYASAEASCWDALRHFAAAIDSTTSTSLMNQLGETELLTALESLSIAETALRESKDFSSVHGSAEPVAIERFIHCHQTKVLRSNKNSVYAVTSAAEAIDRYMNEARIRLSPIAAASVDAAEAMDLLAEVYLGRYEADALPNEISLTLWRAVVQGQPGNSMVASTLGKQLARIGLYEESRWALQHSLTIAADPQTALMLAEVTRRTGDDQAAEQMRYSIAQQFPGALQPGEQQIPVVLQLSPEQFAALSQPVMLQNANYSNEPISQVNTSAKSNGINATLASARRPSSEAKSEFENQPSSPFVIEPPTDSSPSLIKGFMKRLGGSK